MAFVVPFSNSAAMPYVENTKFIGASAPGCFAIKALLRRRRKNSEIRPAIKAQTHAYHWGVWKEEARTNWTIMTTHSGTSQKNGVLIALSFTDSEMSDLLS